MDGLGPELFDGRRWSEGEARRVIAACEVSGESVAEFASPHGIDSQRLYWWRRRLGGSVCELSPTTTAKFVPVTIREGSAATSVAAVVVTIDGVHIDVGEARRRRGKARCSMSCRSY
jgi:transposase-like protein